VVGPIWAIESELENRVLGQRKNRLFPKRYLESRSVRVMKGRLKVVLGLHLVVYLSAFSNDNLWRLAYLDTLIR
jgi:hypothetical protein